jgi:hypothetical protein
MISSRYAINPQAKAVSGMTSRYETPVSSFRTQPAMPSVAELQNAQPPQQAPQTAQPIEAPSTLAAIAAGVGGDSDQAPGMTDGHSYAPANDFEKAVDAAYFGDGTDFMKDRIVSAIANATLAKVMEAPVSTVVKAGIHGSVPGPLSLLGTAVDFGVGAVGKSDAMDEYGPHMEDYSSERHKQYKEDIGVIDDETAAFDPFDDSIADIQENYSPKERAQFGAIEAMQEEAKDKTRNIGVQFGLETFDKFGFVDPKRTVFDDSVIPEELVKRMQLQTNTGGDGGVKDSGLESSFASTLNEDAVREYSDYGIDVRSELPYSPVDPVTFEPLGKAVPSQKYQKELENRFSRVFGDLFGESGGGGGGSVGGRGDIGGGDEGNSRGFGGVSDRGYGDVSNDEGNGMGNGFW